MLETNIRIVNNGMNLTVATRRARLQATSPTRIWQNSRASACAPGTC